MLESLDFHKFHRREIHIVRVVFIDRVRRVPHPSETVVDLRIRKLGRKRDHDLAGLIRKNQETVGKSVLCLRVVVGVEDGVLNLDGHHHKRVPPVDNGELQGGIVGDIQIGVEDETGAGILRADLDRVPVNDKRRGGMLLGDPSIEVRQRQVRLRRSYSLT